MENNRIIVRLKANVSIAGKKVEDFKQESDGFWLEVNQKTKVKYYVPYEEIQEVIDKGVHIQFNE